MNLGANLELQDGRQIQLGYNNSGNSIYRSPIYHRVTTIGLNCFFHHGRRAAFQTRKGLHKRNRQADTRGSRYCQGNESLDVASIQLLTPRILGKCDSSTGEAIIPRKAHTAGQILDVPEWQGSLSDTSSRIGIRSRFNLTITGRHYYNIERCW